MTDLKKLKALLQNFGIEFEEENKLITCSTGARKIEGYSCFYVEFVFNKKEQFETMGIYE